MGEFSGKVALVTGGGSGIGRATCEAFAREGAVVVVSDVDEKGGAETVGRIESAGGKADFLRCDVSDEASVDALFDALLDRHGRLDCAVNNAGIDPEVAPEAEWDIARFDRIFGINIRGVMLCMRREIRQMQAQGGGKIVNTASFAGLSGIPHKPFYVASKHAVVGITKAAGLRHARERIFINAVCPGGTHSPMLEDNMGKLPGGVEGMAKNNPAGRFAEASEMAEAILFLSSDRVNFIVGHPLAVDGGLNAK